MTTLVHLKYGYDRSSNRTHRRDELARSNSAGFDQLYGYDGLNRLTSLQQGTLNSGNSAISSPTLTQDWSLDQTGNWSGYQQGVTGTLNQTRTHNTVNEITGISETVGLPWIDPAHDANGNMTTIPQPEQLDEGYTATYDAWNRLVKLEEDDGAGGLQTVAEYQYDGLGRRTVKKTYSAGALDETRHAYFSDQWQVLEERVDSSTTADKQYVWGQRYVDDLVLRDTPSERLYALQDALFNVVALTDDAGVVKERFAYQPYGQSEELDPDFSSYSGTDYRWKVRFTGRELDLESRLQINRMRYLHLQLGRWIARDDIGYEDGMNLYLARVAVRTTDPTGRNQYTPGQATCQKTVGGMGATPQNVYYLPRGFFRLASVSTYAGADEDNWSRIGSDAFILWKPNATSEFIDDKGCCCCDSVGFLQTVATTTKYSGSGQPVTQQSSWTIDGGIPYPHSTTVSPCASATSIQLTDSPNAPEFYRGVGRRLRALRQDFVACAVCLEGTEGYTWNAWLEYGDLPGNWRINEIVVYGCLRWGHSIHWSDTDGEYKYHRYAEGETATGDSKAQVNLMNFGGAAPNANWKAAVLRRQGW